MIVDPETTAIAYLWECTPVYQGQTLPIYADDEFKFPAAPWWSTINL